MIQVGVETRTFLNFTLQEVGSIVTLSYVSYTSHSTMINEPLIFAIILLNLMTTEILFYS